MIFGEYEKIGLVDKTWKRIRIINSKKDTVDLYTWFFDDRYPNGSNTLYRAKESITIDKLNKDLIRQKIGKGELRKVMSITKTGIN